MNDTGELSAEAVLDRLTHDRYDEKREGRYRARRHLGAEGRTPDRPIEVVRLKRRSVNGGIQ